MHVRHWENSGGNIWDKYTVKMFPQAYRDIDKIYGQALLVSKYAADAIALAEKLEKEKGIVNSEINMITSDPENLAVNRICRSL